MSGSDGFIRFRRLPGLIGAAAFTGSAATAPFTSRTARAAPFTRLAATGLRIGIGGCRRQAAGICRFVGVQGSDGARRAPVAACLATRGTVLTRTSVFARRTIVPSGTFFARRPIFAWCPFFPGTTVVAAPAIFTRTARPVVTSTLLVTRAAIVA